MVANNSSNKMQHDMVIKKLDLHYQNLFQNFFELINLIIDEKTYNIKKIKRRLQAVCDDNSYQLMGKDVIQEYIDKGIELNSPEYISMKIQDFRNNFYGEVLNFPSDDFNKIRNILKNNQFKFEKLSYEEFKIMYVEYYDFFEQVIHVLQRFVEVSVKNGLFPMVDKRGRTINFAKYDFFFIEFQNLKEKVSRMSEEVTSQNMLKIKRTLNLMVIVFQPYYKMKELNLMTLEKLKLEEYNSDEQVKLLYDMYILKDERKISNSLRLKQKELITQLEDTVSYVRGYMSNEFGEVGITPKIKKKYAHDPTWT